jgi:hypothetical protein
MSMIQHKESTVMVYFSTDYGLFKMIAGNRDLNEGKINRIMKDINEGIDVLKYYPIQVKENSGRLEIIDGQHRFFIAKKLGRAVYYIVMKEDRSLFDIAKINSNTEKWKTRDFINCYVNLDNPHYKELDAFMVKYGLSATLSVRLLEEGEVGYGSGGSLALENFQRGKFEVRFRDEATQLADVCYMFNDFKHARSANFFQAIHKIMKANKIDIWDLVKKFNAYKDDLQHQGSWKDYVSNLETIYNKKLQNRVIIYE